MQRGVFYTPQPVVSYIVRSVHELLQTEFGLEDGLASTITWGEMAEKQLHIPVEESLGEGEFNIPAGTDPDSPFVVILDPATGTATFLVEVIDIIYRTLTEKWRKRGMNDKQRETAWNDYVPKHLLPRLYGYELMMAPYAIAHMKIGLKLHETGYRFGSGERARIYLTNALESASDDKKQMEFEEVIPALAHEAKAVNTVKRGQRFTVVIGNPPYFGHSVNNGDWIVGLLRKRIVRSPGYFEVDGAPLGERNPKWLNDDYVKFIRWAQVTIEQAQTGLLGYITNHGYLDNPTFRGMRQSLLCTFGKNYLLDLHGNSKRKEKAEDGSKDENVFDIQLGVAIGIFVKRTGSAFVRHADLSGLRESKYRQLQTNSLVDMAWHELAPQLTFYLFVPQDSSMLAEYEHGWKITDIMPVNSVGIVTARDALTIHWSREDAWRTVTDFATLPTENAREKYMLGKDSQDWKVALAQADLNANFSEQKFAPILYRPFDVRHTYYTGKPSGFHCRPRGEVMRQMLAGKNLGLITSRLTKGETFQHAQVSKNIVEVICMSPKTSNNGFVFPLYLYPKPYRTDLFDEETTVAPGGRQSNLAPAFISALASALNLNFMPDGKGDLNTCFGPEDVFGYVYAVFHSPTYCTRYAEFLRIDFPRLPLTRSLELFRELSKLGAELVSLHLLESPKISQFITRFTGEGDNTIPKKPTYKDGAV